MERRRVLRALAGAVGGAWTAAGGHDRADFAGAAAAASATDTPSDTPTPLPPTARPERFGPLGRLALPGTREVVVGPAGRYAYAAVGDGFAVVDCADPSDPALVHENRAVADDRDDGPLADIYDVKHDAESDLLAAVGPANGGHEGFRGAAVFDVADPAAPERVALVETPWFNHNCVLNAGTLYLATNDGVENALVAYDARAGDRLGRWSITSVEPGWTEVPLGLWPLHDLWVQGGTAYLAHWDAGTWLVDVSDPAEPAYLGRLRGTDPAALADRSDEDARRASVERPGNDHFVAVDGGGTLLGVGVEAWDVGESDSADAPGGIHLFDVSDPADPTELAVVEPPPTDDASFGGTWTTAHNFEFRGGRLLSAWYQGGVRVHDVSDPADPREVAAWRDDARTSFWTARGATDRFFVAGSRRDPRTDRRQETAGAAVYTFPLDPGTPTTSPTPSEPGSPAGDVSDGENGSGAGGTTARTGAEPTPATATDTRMPGFGVGSALAALAGGVGVWRVLCGRGDGEGGKNGEGGKEGKNRKDDPESEREAR